MPEIPSKVELDAQAHEGQPITQAEASDIAASESLITERGPIKGGAAATAQSLHDRQQNFLEKAGEVARKPADEVTKEDAAAVQRAEVRTPVQHRRKMRAPGPDVKPHGRLTDKHHGRHGCQEARQERGPRRRMCSPSRMRMPSNKCDLALDGGTKYMKGSDEEP